MADLLYNAISNEYFLIIVVLIATNYLVAIFLAYKNGEFKMHKLWEVYPKKVLPMCVSYISFDVVEQIIQGGPLNELVLIPVISTLLADLLEKLEKIPSIAPYIENLPEFTRKNNE